MKYLRKLHIVSIVFLSSLLFSIQSNATDLSIKDDVSSGYSWTGAYVGFHAGFGVGDTDGVINELFVPGVFELTSDYEVNGALYGGQIGYNWQNGNLVFGINASYSGSEIDGAQNTCESVLVIITADCDRELEWLATVTGRIGYASGRTMVYAHGGVAWGEIDTNIDVNFIGLGPIATLSGSETHTGYVVGLGLQHALSDNLVVGIEYSHIDLGDENHGLSAAGGPTGLSSNVEMEIDSINMTVNWKF